MIEYITYSNIKSVGPFRPTAHGAQEPEQYWGKSAQTAPPPTRHGGGGRGGSIICVRQSLHKQMSYISQKNVVIVG